MQFVLDANILLSLMNPASAASYLFSSMNVEFSAPAYIREEMEAHKSEFLSKSALSEQEFGMRWAEVKDKISFTGASRFKEFLNKAADALSDPKDAQYLALAVSLKAAIWSNDPDFKQQSIAKAYTTAELIEELLNDRL